jgi:hypothetical protein
LLTFFKVQGSEVQRQRVARFRGSGLSGSEVQGSGFSPAAGLKSGQSNQKRNSEKANIEYRTRNNEGRRIKEPLIKENNELISIFVTSMNTTKRNKKKIS